MKQMIQIPVVKDNMTVGLRGKCTLSINTDCNKIGHSRLLGDVQDPKHW